MTDTNPIQYDEYRTPGGPGHWGAGLAGVEVCDTGGHLLGPVIGTAALRYPGTPVTDVVMVRRIHGDGQVRAYEQSEITEHVAEGHIVPRRKSLQYQEGTA